MIVYADRAEELDPRRILARVRALGTGHDALVSALVELGELEAGVADAWQPDEDELDPRLVSVRAATLGAARALVASWWGLPVPPRADLDEAGLPERIRVSVPEGYAWYALLPEAYADAARAWAAASDPGDVVVVGLRSIGTGLSAVVHAALEVLGWRVRSFTVRPRGHPFDRAPRIGAALGQRLRAARVLIVDEGPGLSGSSLCGTAAAIARLGVPDRAITLVCAWCPDGSALRSASARERWDRHPKVVARSLEVLAQRWGPGEDWSAGRWRAALGCSAPVEPRHERVKRAVGGELARFAGLGRHGERVRERAERLAEAGIGPAVRSLRGGLLWQERVWGRPCAVGDPRLAAAVTARVRVARTMASARPVPVDGLVEMIETNLAEAGLPVPRLDGLRAMGGEATVAIDGRMAAHEWVATGAGLVKTDGHDHCADHFFPGFQDVAWDVAGAGIELGTGVRDAVLDALADRALAARVPLYEVAYAAFRVGYATFARDGAEGEERARWERELERLRREALRAIAGLR